MKELTRQEIFTTVEKHLLTQKCRSEDSSGYCMYRGPGGRRCAAGALLPDSLYSKHLEGCSVMNERGVFKAAGVRDEDIEFLQRLQNIHDCMPVEDWRKELTGTAELNGLNISDV